MSSLCDIHLNVPSPRPSDARGSLARHGSAMSLGLHLLGSWITPQYLSTDPSSGSTSPFPTPPPRRLLGHVANSLRFSPLPGMGRGGTHSPDIGRNSAAAAPLHRASYHGHSKYAPDINGMEMGNQMLPSEEKVIGSAENLVGRVLQEQGLGRYLDPEFVKTTQRELAEAINLSPEELDRAAHRLLPALYPHNTEPGQPNYRQNYDDTRL